MRDWRIKLYVFWWHVRNSWENFRAESKLDARICCDGRECGCEAQTYREYWTREIETE